MNHPRAYEGKEPYIFISYAHKDVNVVLPIISKLQDRGYRVWYDAGIAPGTEWPEYIAQHLRNSTAFVAFVSRASLDSLNCKREINFAIAQSRNLLAVYLDELENLSMSWGMQMQLGSVQGMFFCRHRSADTFVDELCNSEMLTPCGSGKKSRGGMFGGNLFRSKQEERPEDAAQRGMELFEQRRYSEAVKPLRYAAEHGLAVPQTLLGLCYSQGYGVSQNPQEAARWYRKAAEQGEDNGQYMLGMCYCAGAGVAEDVDEGIRWIQKSADQGNEDAISLLDTLGYSSAPKSSGKTYDPVPNVDADTAYRTGQEYYDRREYARAIPYLAQAVEKHHTDAMYLLGKCYFFGEGITQDVVMGYALMEEASDRGSYMAKMFLKSLDDTSNPLNDPIDF